MHLRRLLPPLTLLLPLTLSAPLDSQTPLDPSSDLHLNYRIPTRYESAVLGRRLLAVSSFGVISTIFPPRANESTATPPPLVLTPPPHTVSSLSISLPEYISDCDSPATGNPTLLLLDPSTPSRNTRAPPQHGPHTNVSLSLSWWDQYRALTGHSPWSPASLPRLSLLGYLEEIPVREAEETGLVACYLGVHPDARYWLPGDKKAAHGGRWLRMVVREVYWVGGFGDRHFIGWLDEGEWKAVGRVEWERVRLPGEK